MKKEDIKDISIFCSHPDDEIIFFCSLLPFTKKIICCTSDIYNTRNPKWDWTKRKVALLELGQVLNIEIICLDNSSHFSDEPDKELYAQEILNIIKDEKILYTHNPWGEYGHVDHIFVNQIAKQSDIPLLMNDIRFGRTNIPLKEFLNENIFIDTFYTDKNLYEKCKNIYI